MSSYRLTTWQWLLRPREEVFRFFSDARNLPSSALSSRMISIALRWSSISMP